jgi:hypothetical protein
MRRVSGWGKVFGLMSALAVGAVVVGVFRVCDARSLTQRPPGTTAEDAQIEAFIADREARLQHRREIKDAALAALLARQISLLEAARQFRDANETDPVTAGTLREALRDTSTDEDLYCRHVIGRVAMLLSDRPAEAKAEAARLHAELDEYRAHDALHFPGE